VNGLLLTLAWLGLSLAGWLVVSTAAALLVGKGIALADERQVHPEPTHVPFEDAA
jgi:hypothetical protein